MATAEAPTSTADIRSALSADNWSVEELLADVSAAGWTRPFDDLSVAFCERLSRDLMSMRNEPQAVALGYWLRPASVARARTSLEGLESSTVILVPRGLAFHVTPANVDTVFAYSWLLSLLAGNANIVRLSSRGSDLRSRLLHIVGSALAEPGFQQLQRRNRIVLTAHDEHVAREICAVADVRVVWGGDETVRLFREYPMPPRGREVTFSDRHSLALLDADAVTAATENRLAGLADRFFNDAYWYDQGACSSPRLLLWQASGSGGTRATGAARRRFHEAVEQAITRRGYQAQTGMAISKLTFALARAAAIDGVGIETASNELTWVSLPDISAYDRDSCGGGIFFEVESSDLKADLLALIGSEDQTAACFGLAPDAVRRLARTLNGRGIDRFVSIGRALEFGNLWDGFDLLSEFTKRVMVDVGA